MQATPLTLPALAGLCVLLAIVVLHDVRERRIPNHLVVLIALSGVLQAALAGGPAGARGALLGALLGGALLWFPWRLQLLGGGDLKLLAALGAWLGPARTPKALLGAALLAGLLSLVALARVGREERARIGRNLRGAVLLRTPSLPPPSAISRARGIPFAIALSLAALGVLALPGVP